MIRYCYPPHTRCCAKDRPCANGNCGGKRRALWVRNRGCAKRSGKWPTPLVMNLLLLGTSLQQPARGKSALVRGTIVMAGEAVMAIEAQVAMKRGGIDCR